ncbi:MAG: 4-hydroxy-tetrahydrodipicolinate reductase [Solirubrobacterales bacterium]|nr:4-hydroxy-tetrahydrodipicolinate reductase [Solirubrobacterales bacterium]MCB8970091.1 4-hydroxy-tetrahydrodipicolinate reductase [Thermoleophilales bacterium]MCO5326813.1 4-hydroxy-tetrahydrodipicolinate reductase [Solirubrobacterales bacterium]
MPEPIRVAVAGAAGRMGATVCDAVEAAEGLELSGRADPALDTELADVLDAADVVVDFTIPDTALGNAINCLEAGVSVVVGTTGFDLGALREAAERSWSGGEGPRAFVAPNFAIGAVLMMQIGRAVAAHMPEVEIVELHHDRKLDKPSGTAARTAELLRDAGANVHEPIHSIRLPGLVAHQELVFGGEGQTLTIRHDSIDRSSFMPGVVLACRRVGSLPDPLTVGLEALL